MLGDILDALTRYEVVVGALVAGGLGVAFVLLNKWQKWWVSADLVATERARAAEAREDGRERAAQVRADSQAELDRLLKVVDVVQREVESWRQAFHLADQANREEDDARWAQIQSSTAVLERFITELQRQAMVQELEAGRDGGGPDVR